MRSFAAVLLAVTMLFVLAPRALAAEVRTTVVDAALITEQATHLFSIGWERGTLSVTLIAPDGTRIAQDAPPAGVRVAVSDRIVLFRVDNAMPGLWKAEFQEYDNGKVGVIVQKLFHPLTVENVTATQQGGDILVGFSVSGEPGKTCSYDIYLTPDGQYQNGALLASGSANVGDTASILCPATAVNSYDRWQAVVYAECVSDGFTDFHSASSLPFTYANAAAPGMVKDLAATLIEGGVRVTWQPPDSEGITGYLALLYGEDGLVIHSVAVDGAQREALLPLAADGVLQAGVSAVREPVASLPQLVTVDTTKTMKALLGFDLPKEPDATGGFVELNYAVKAALIHIKIERDGTAEEMIITGDGVLRLPVKNGVNRVSVSALGGDGVWLSQSRTWNIDLAPPILRLFEDWDAAVTEEDVLLLAGNVDGAAAVKVNEQDARIEENGNFSAELDLAEGTNLITVTAEDDAGNTTVYTARVIREKTASDFPWVLVIGMAAATVVVLLYALHAGRRRRT